MHQRVCLEQSPVVRTKMLYKRWKASKLFTFVWKSSEPNWPTDNLILGGEDFRRRLSEGVCKSPYAAGRGNTLGGER